jgi:hypothetical protein
MVDKKAYCEKCRYWMGRGSWTLDNCRAPDNVFEEDTPKSRQTRYRQTPEEKNANNDCQSYRLYPRNLYTFLLIAVAVVGYFAVCVLPTIVM